jgi:hypothetical protein
MYDTKEDHPVYQRFSRDTKRVVVVAVVVVVVAAAAADTKSW